MSGPITPSESEKLINSKKVDCLVHIVGHS